MIKRFRFCLIKKIVTPTHFKTTVYDIPINSNQITSLQRLHTFITSRVKVQKNFGPNHAVLARHNTTLMCECIGTLRGFYKDSLTSSSPLRFQPLGECTLPQSERTPQAYQTPLAGRVPLLNLVPPLAPFDQVLTSQRNLINQPRPEPCSLCGCVVFPGGSPWLILIKITNSSYYSKSSMYKSHVSSIIVVNHP